MYNLSRAFQKNLKYHSEEDLPSTPENNNHTISILIREYHFYELEKKNLP